MPQLTIHLDISKDELLPYYRGIARNIVARATNGQTVQFPMSALHKMILPEGVHGRFRIEFDENHKFIAIERVVATER